MADCPYNSTDSCLAKQVEFVALRVCFPIVVGLGTLGNIVSILVWSKGQACRKLKCSMYFVYLAIADLMVLAVSGSLMYLHLGLYMDIQTKSAIWCKLFTFGKYFTTQVSAWLCVLITIERAVSILFPIKFRLTRATKRASIAFVGICLVSLVFNGHDLVFWVSEYVDGVWICTNHFMKYQLVIESVSYIGFTTVAPFCIIIVCNVSIVIKLRSRKLQMHDNNRSGRQTKTFTKVSIGIGTIFIMTSLPHCVLNIILASNEDISMDVDLMAYAFCAVTLAYTNSAVNVLLYCVFATGFRKDIKVACGRVVALCCRRRRQENSSENVNSTSGQTIDVFVTGDGFDSPNIEPNKTAFTPTN